MRRWVYSFMVVLLLFTGGSARAVSETIFEHYTSLDGLSNNYISDITVDKKGFVWLCTWYGLSRFDGYRFRNYQTLPGDDSPISHNRFLHVKQGISSDLWLTTYDHRLYRFNISTERFEPMASSPQGKGYKTDIFFNDSHNNTWIGASGVGLMCARYDKATGEYHNRYYFDRAEIGRRIYTIIEDESANIWVLSGSGLVKILPETESVNLILSKRKLSGLTQTKTDVVALTRHSLIFVDKRSGASHERVLYPDDEITSVAVDHSRQVIYVGTRSSGVGRYHIKEKRLEGDERLRLRVRDLHCDSKGVLWITTSQAGITRYNPQVGDYKRFLHTMNVPLSYSDSTTRILERNDVTLVKMNRWGFGRYDRQADDIVPMFNDPKQGNSRFDNSAICFDLDSTNVLWFSTQARGLERVTSIDAKADIFKPQSSVNNSASNDIRALCVDSKGNMWSANKSGELFCYDSTRTLRHKFIGDVGVVYSIKEDTKGNIWLGTKSDGVFKLTPTATGFTRRNFRYSSSDENSLSGNSVYSIEQDSKGRLWFGCYGGAISMMENTDATSFKNCRNAFVKYPVDIANKVRYIKQLPSGIMLVATTEGLIVFDPETKSNRTEFKRYQKVPNDIHSLGNNDIIHIFVDSGGRTWLSIYGGGLNLLTGFKQDGTPVFELFSVETSSLSSNIVFASIEDREGNIWVATENGISKLDVDRHRFSNYTKYDGVPQTSYNEATLTRDKNNLLLFGTSNNIYIINPDRFKVDKADFKLTFTSFEVGNDRVLVGEDSPLKESVTRAKEITLPYDYSIFKIDYASLNFRAQSRLGYMYILQGHDTDWNIVGDIRSASYSNVPVGSYTFRVRCSDGSSSDEATIQIKILPPWWRTTVAYIIYALLFCVVAYMLLKMLYTMLLLRQRVAVEHQLTEHKLKFFTNISHELKTPLTIIMGGVEDIAGQKLPVEQQQTVDMVYRNAKRMLRLINQLLDFRKIVNNKFIINISDVDVVSLCRAVMDDFRELAKERNIELLISTSCDSLIAAIDPEAIESVVTNLLSNAFKFTSDNGRVEMKIVDKRDCFTIEVVDNGVGIPKDKQKSIFERFSQLSKRAPRGEKGSGIGLSISKDIVEMHNGTIEVESRVGAGAKFVVTIPCRHSDALGQQLDAESLQTAASDVQIKPLCPEDAPKVLLVEDNVELRIFLTNKLSDAYKIYQAQDGIDALERLQEVTPDIIVTDLMMPRMDGNEFVKRVRGDFSISHIPVIILTAKSEQQVRIDAMKYGADGYITKPFSVELLEARIENLLSNRRRLFESYSSKAAGAKRVIDLSPTEILITDRDEEFIRSTMSWIDENIESSELTIDDLASHLNLGRTTMYNKLKSLTGKSPVELIKEYRVNKAAMYLKNGQFAISEVAYKVGFSDPGYFSKCFKEMYGQSPAEYIKSNK